MDKNTKEHINSNYTLVYEEMPNSFEPVLPCVLNDLKDIDNLTGKYSKDDFKNMLVQSIYMKPEDDADKLQIIFNNNGIRKVNEGIIYKDTFTYDMTYYVIRFINIYKDNGDIINELYQYINNKKTVSLEGKIILKEIVNKRKDDVMDYEMTTDLLNNVCYYDIRTMYLFIINVLLVKIRSKLNECNDSYGLRRVNNK